LKKKKGSTGLDWIIGACYRVQQAGSGSKNIHHSIWTVEFVVKNYITHHYAVQEIPPFSK